MMLIILCVLILIVLCVAEYGRHKGLLHGEFGRKFVHITVGTMVAFAPYFLSWNQIRLLSVAFIVAVIISSRLSIFRVIHSVTRPTWGEVFFALAVGVVSFITDDPAIYTVALLHMAVADGLAAIIGSSYGKSTAYKIFGHHKSIIGSLVFMAISFGILQFYSWQGTGLSLALCVELAVLSTLLENISIRGADNFVVPIVVAVVLGTV